MATRQKHRKHYAQPAPKPAAKLTTLCESCCHRFDAAFQCPTSAKTERRNGLLFVLECDEHAPIEAEPVTA